VGLPAIWLPTIALVIRISVAVSRRVSRKERETPVHALFTCRGPYWINNFCGGR